MAATNLSGEERTGRLAEMIHTPCLTGCAVRLGVGTNQTQGNWRDVDDHSSLAMMPAHGGTPRASDGMPTTMSILSEGSEG